MVLCSFLVRSDPSAGIKQDVRQQRELPGGLAPIYLASASSWRAPVGQLALQCFFVYDIDARPSWQKKRALFPSPQHIQAKRVNANFGQAAMSQLGVVGSAWPGNSLERRCFFCDAS